ncbi:MAG: phenylalanine--tRNA ligase subunit beta [Acidocella sp.]|nr:phenylalanine--tRNA ligase subunit beta [Acidocella sp.]
MKFTLSWLKTWLETGASLGQITETLSAIGLEVEAVTDRGAALAAFVIAEVVEALPHPNADRLRACTVNAGGGHVSVVCGAPNARAGMRAVFAPPGAYIPGSGITLKTGEIRGVKSEGMLVSFRELGLGDEHDGIIELPNDAPIGTAYAAWAGLDDPVIEVSVTPNRGDALSVRGIARDLAAAGLGTLRGFAPPPITGEGAASVVWDNQFEAACPWVLGRSISGVKNGPSPEWLKTRLESVGLRPINALADITNFFTLDLGRPLHVFDASKITGNLLYLRAGQGESFMGLHGKPVTVGAEDCVIADAAGVQSLAGIMGGEATGTDDETTEVFIECALFDRVRIAQTGQRLGIFSDARQRFERGIDSQLLPAALDAATAMIMEVCGGRPSLVTKAGARPDWRRMARLRFDRIASFGGAEMSADDAVASLEMLGFTVQARDAQSVRVAVPSWRNDIAQPPALDQADVPNAAIAAAGAAEIEPEVDLLEEILRLRGLDAITPVSLPVEAAVASPAMTPKQARNGLARRVLAARGMLECVTFSFLDHNVSGLFGDAPESLRLANPIAADLDQMRPTPLATLALAAARNAARGLGDFGLFEVGPAYTGAAAQALVAAGLRVGGTALSAITAPRRYDVWDAKADALAVLAALGMPLEAVTTSLDAGAYYHPGQSGVLRQGPKTVLAAFGTLHPKLCARLDLPGGSVAFEIFLDAVAAPKRRGKAPLVLSPLQPIRRDFAFLVDKSVAAESLLRAARGAARQVISEVVLFDRYEGAGVPEGQVSLAIAVTLQPMEKSFSDAEIEGFSAKIVADVAKKTGGVLRG